MEPYQLEKLIKIRRTLHQNPELGYLENETSTLVKKELERLGIPFESSIGTGIIATLSKGSGPRILLRADMDALPITEDTQLSFSSKTNGVMHACGHDLHVTILLGTAQLLKERDYEGTVIFVFQPSEEGNSNDPFTTDNKEKKSGGQRIAESGILSNVKTALGLHVHPLLKTGSVAFCLDEALAATCFFTIDIIGKAGHAAFPHLTIDPVYIASKIILDSYSLISRYVDPSERKVLTFTDVSIGNKDHILQNPENVISGFAKISGTIRALNGDILKLIQEKLKLLIKGIELSDSAEISINYTLNYPSLKNDKKVHEKLMPVLKQIFSEERIIEEQPIMGGEDFAFYSQKTKSMFYFLGANDGNNKFFLHHPKVVFDEKCIDYGVELLTSAAQALMKE
ncbi:M20 family metallopeptidase [Pedobacter gandavensis]|uniref:M20 metallopeptidase family protein n=1 Tax=Pedobacter gandavensis TaxID=2679963 RepID=UPI00292FA732|nr:M20 family metallopeptidase [Pedobacter gandavensis]